MSFIKRGPFMQSQRALASPWMELWSFEISLWRHDRSQTLTSKTPLDVLLIKVHTSLLIELTQGPSPLILWMTWWQNPHLAALLPSAPVPLLTFPVTCVVWVFTAPLEALIRSGWWGSGPVGSSFSYADLVVVSQRLKVLLNFTCSELLRRSWISSSALKIEVCRKEINKFTHWLKEEWCAGVFHHQSCEIWKVSPDQLLFSVFF